jgi:hypothetical protein
MHHHIAFGEANRIRRSKGRRPLTIGQFNYRVARKQAVIF